jgi:hypothetical protein
VNYYRTKSMGQSTPRAVENFFAFYRAPKVHYRIHTSHPLVPIRQYHLPPKPWNSCFKLKRTRLAY